LGSLALLVPAFLISLYAGWPSNVLNPTGSDPLRKYVAMSVPQGWAFFTKPPDDPEIGVYDAQTGRSALATPQTRVENAFGLSRTQRAQGPELATLASQITGWKTCETKTRDCLKVEWDEQPERVRNESFVRTICGPVFVTSERPVPWAYRDFGLASKVEQRAYLDVDCSERVAVP
jgi:antimicrobial peptide system SdpA family protein